MITTRIFCRVKQKLSQRTEGIVKSKSLYMMRVIILPIFPKPEPGQLSYKQMEPLLGKPQRMSFEKWLQQTI